MTMFKKLKAAVQALSNIEKIILTFVVAALPPVIAYVTDPSQPIRVLVGAVLGAILATALKLLEQQ